jgi:hypothetical protein
MSLRYVTRAHWGARPYRPGGNRFTPPIVGSTIHWEGTPSGVRAHDKCAALVRQIQAFHMDSRGWTDIAYNLAVCAHGYVYEGRGKDRGNGANGDSSNATRYSICALVGDGDPQPAALLDGLRDAVQLARSWGAGPSVDGHRDHQSTACPGDALYAFVKAGIPAPKPPTGGGGDMTLAELLKTELTIKNAATGKAETASIGALLVRAGYAYSSVTGAGPVPKRLGALERRVDELEKGGSS